MGKKINAENELCKILQTEINNCIDEELIKSIKDPNYIPDLTPVTFKTEEDKEIFRKMVKRNLEG